MRFLYPLRIQFKFFALVPQLTVVDREGTEVFYVEQKLLQLKEDIRVYAQSSKQHELFRIHADRIIDFDGYII